MSDEDRFERWVSDDLHRWIAREAEWEQLDADLDRYFEEDRVSPAPEPVDDPLVLTFNERSLLCGVLAKTAAAFVLLGNERAALQLTILAAKVKP